MCALVVDVGHHPLFFVVVDGEFLFYIAVGRVGCRSDLERGPCFFGGSKLEIRIL